MRNKLLLSLFLIVLMIGVQGKFTKLLAQLPVEYSYTGVCVGSPTVFTVNTAITNVANVQTWNWNFGDGNFSNIQNPTHTFAGFGTYTVTLTITDINGLVGSVVHFVTIQKLPIANFAYNTPNCSNDSVQFTDLSSTELGFIKYWVWNFGDGTPVDTVFFPFGNNTDVKHVFPSAGGTFMVTLSIMNSDSCKNSVSLPVVITPSPIANFFFTGRCEDQVVQFTDASFANGAGNVVAWNWDFGDPISGINNVSNLTNPTHVFLNPGTYTVLLLVTNFNNCTDTISKQVVINPHPPVDFTFTSTCLNELTFFKADTAVMEVNAIFSWLWDFGDGLTSNAPQNTAHSFISPGTYIVTLTVTDTLGCMNVITHQVVVNALPFAHFDAGTSNCAGSTVTFTDHSTTTAGYIIRWDWDFGDGNTQTVLFNANPNVQHVYALSGTYPVTLTVKASDSCTQTETQNITIHPNPIANFDFSTPTCLGTAVDFTDISQLNGAGSIVQWQWDFGDPGSGILNFTTTQNPSHVFTAAGTFTVKFVVSSGNGCTDTITRNVIVKPLPPVDFNTTHNCQNNAVIFTPDPLVMNLAVIPSFFWEFGDGVTSTLPNPTHIYTVAGPYNVILTIVDTAGCTNTITKPITIVPEPTANFSYSQPACKQSEVTFTNLSSSYGYIVKCEWDFGDGGNTTVTTLAPVTHTYLSYNTFNVSLTVTTNDSCKRTITLPVTILPNPLANFSYLTSCVNTPVQFQDLSQAGAGALAGWDWNFGDPPSGSNNVSTLPAPTHLFNAGGTYVVTLIVSNSGGCTDTIQKNVLVHGLPTVDFTSSPGCVNDSTHFVSSTFVNAAAVVSRLWDFGDGFTSPDIDPYHMYALSGSFTVTLTVTDTAGCINTISHTVSIVPPPTSLFQISVQTCANTPVFFTNQSSTPGGTITSYFWEFGDNSDTLLNAPSSGSIAHTYVVGGNYTVKLTIHTSLGCEATSQRPLTISASPLALFSYDNTCAGAAVNFNDLSQLNSGTMIVNWFWDFGDPGSGTNNTSTLQNPLHIYNTPGTYTVLLEVDNASGCPDTVSKTIVISPKPPVDYSWANTCLGNSTQFTTNTTVTNIAAVASYDWDFGDGTAHNTSQQDPIHAYSTTGNFTVILTITDTAGCENSVSHVVTITPQPTALFSFASACLGASTYFTDQSFTSSGEPITAWHWDFGVTTASNDTSNLQNPSWIYATLGVYNVSLIVTSQNGCQDTTLMTLQVFGNPNAAFTYTAAPCNNGAVYFQDSSYSQQSTIVGWNWEFEPNSFSTLQNPVYVFYAVDSCYDVRLIVTDVRGCVDTTYKNVCVPDVFDFTFAPVTPATCLNDTTYFVPQLLSPSTDSLVFFNWNFGDPTSGVYNTSTLKLPYHYYSVPGTYTVSLEATDINTCSKKVYQDIVVLPLPVPAFSYTEGICDSTITFKQSSSGSGSNIITWVWNYGDGTDSTIIAPASADLPHKYPAPGLYIVNLTVTNANGCSNMIADSNLLVKPCINAEFSLIDTLICQNNLLSFSDSSSSGLPTTEWYWNFGDGKDTTYYNRGNPINHVFETAGTYTVTMRITTNVAGQDVSDSTNIIVFVNPTPLPDFTSGIVCYLQNALFTNMTSGNGTKISTYNWTFGEPTSIPNDTSTLKNPSHLYNAPGTYDVKLVTQNTIGCTDSIQKSLIVYGLPDANYAYTLSCAGDKTAFNDLSVEAIAPIVDWEWTFNDNTGVIGRREIQNPEYIFMTPGDYLVNLMVTDTNGCIDTINQNITTWNVPTTIFTYADNFNDVQGQLQFTNTSIDASKYYWTFGNGDDSYGENPVAFYQNDGTYDIMLVTWNDKNCTDTLTLEYKFMVKGLYIPNAFSPNSPKVSVQLLKPVGINLEEYRFEVYDRWGNMLWWTDKLDASGRPTEGWDGKYNGVIMPEGAYVWKATGIFKDGTIWDAENIGNNDFLPKVKTGTATMIK